MSFASFVTKLASSSSRSTASAIVSGGFLTISTVSTACSALPEEKVIENQTTRRAPAPNQPLRPSPTPIKHEPRYTRRQVSLNDGIDGHRMWVTYRDGVYDITEFQQEHPGGAHMIKQAAGSDVGPFWDVWSYHHLAPKVGDYLEKLRIGSLVTDEGGGEKHNKMLGKNGHDGDDDDDPYKAEPLRDKNVQRIFFHRPYCSETPNETLAKSYLTSASALYVRNHAPVPDCAFSAPCENHKNHAKKHEVVFGPIEGSEGRDNNHDGNAKVYTIEELQSKFKTVTITSILQCAGNRASEDIAATGPSGFTGTPFENITQGMIGNAQWTGVRLADVLPTLYPKECASAKMHGEGEWHLVLEGEDGYSSSTPLSRVLDHKNDCLLATQMNGQPLSPDHGYPVRAILPGVAGARNVKWLTSISLQRQPVVAPWNSYYYKNAKAGQIQGLPLQSIILTVKHQKRHCVKVSGVAYSGSSGNAIARVEVSKDCGKSWKTAVLHIDEIIKDDSRSNFGWVRWSTEIETEGKTGSMNLCCRAVDSDGITQMEAPAKERGYIFNGWSKVEVKLPQ